MSFAYKNISSHEELAFVHQKKCFASQKKSTSYEQKVVLRKTKEEGEAMEVAWTSCIGCLAGTDGGLCHHVFAILESMEYYGPKPNDKTSLPGRAPSVRSQRFSWGPRKRNVVPQPVMQTVVERANMDEERQGKALSCGLHGARGGNVCVSACLSFA